MMVIPSGKHTKKTMENGNRLIWAHYTMIGIIYMVYKWIIWYTMIYGDSWSMIRCSMYLGKFDHDLTVLPHWKHG